MESSIQILSRFSWLVNSVYEEGKKQQRNDLRFEEIFERTCRGMAVDSGRVRNDNFTVRKTDLYGNGATFLYIDEEGSILVNMRFLLSSCITVKGNDMVKGKDLCENPQAMSYVKNAIEYIKNIL